MGVFHVVQSQNTYNSNTNDDFVIISWNDSKVQNLYEENNIEYLNFDGAIYDPANSWMPYYTSNIKLGYGEYTVDFVIENAAYEPLNTSESRIVRLLGYDASEIEVNTYISTKRKVKYAEVNFIPIRKNQSTGQFEKLVSFTLKANSQRSQNSNLRASRSRVFKNQSVLNSGDWYKLSVVTDGVYRLSYQQLISLGINETSLLSDNIRLFGNGGGMLPFDNSEDRRDDLEEIAIEIVDGGDNRLDPGDYVLFYGQGQDRWERSASSYVHVKNYMADSTYYFITTDYSIGTPKRIVTHQTSGNPSVTFNTFEDYQFHESDRVNLIKSGREWFGESFAIQKSYSFPFTFPNLITNEQVHVRARVAARTIGRSSEFSFAIGGNNVFDIAVGQVSSGYASQYARVGSATNDIFLNSGSFSVVANFNNPSTSDMGWLDYIEVVAKRRLQMVGNQMFFRNSDELAYNTVQYVLTYGNNDLSIWNVTDHNNAFAVTAQRSSNQFTFNGEGIGEIDEYVAFRNTDFLVPTLHGRVTNQNLHALTQAEYIMVVHPMFMTQARQLADFHESHYGYDVKIVSVFQVYNEFSGGNQDITAIKDFVKMFYDRAGNDDAKMPKYLLLFGDASYDYKDFVSGNSNMIPSYQSQNSIEPVRSYVSDDYFGFLDDSESDGLTSSLDVGIGRFPVKTTTEANNVVQKVIKYHQKPDVLQPWRSWLTFVGDDEDGRIHMRNADELAIQVQNKYANYNLRKIYFDAYPQQTTAAGQRYPDVNEAISEAVEQGTLIITYVGHGGETGWGHERVLTVSEINNWVNDDRYSLFLTATCEFSRYDDPQRTSAGEYVLLNPDGGGIALLTTTRLVYSSPNQELAETFYDYVFEKSNNKYPTLGDLLRYSKDPNNITQTNGINYRNFALLGDPGVVLAYPDYQVVTSDMPDTVRALGKVTVKGYVADVYGQKLDGFNGTLYPRVFDQKREIETLNNDNIGAFRFETQTNLIFSGRAGVENGDFEFSYVVPKDISYDYGKGRIGYYASNNSTDAMGYDTSFSIGGVDTNAPSDNTAPEVNLWMNDESFIMGGITDENPSLYAKVYDENGINTVGNGIGHDILAVLDENTADAIVLNDYYESETNSYQRGIIQYPFSRLEEGKHTLTLKVWDVYNNSTETQTEFIVANSSEFAIRNVLNYPNPFTTYTEFHFDHNAPGQPVAVRLQIFTVSGKLVKTIDSDITTDGYHVGPIKWDGRDEFGDEIGVGTYIYRVQVTPPSGEKVMEYEKLVILK